MRLVKHRELRDRGIILEEEFSLQGISEDLARIYLSYETRFQNLFRRYAEINGLNNICFFIIDSNSCNASATNREGFNIISITNGFPILIENSFKEEFFTRLVLVGLINNQSTSEAYADLYQNPHLSIKTFMLECSVRFTFFHEFRHILQFNSLKSPSKGGSYSEHLDKSKFSLTRHAREFDADRIASFEVLKYVFSIHRNLSARSDEKFICLLLFGVASIVITINLFYFGIINQMVVIDKAGSKIRAKAHPFYTEKYSHPHPLSRIVNILDYFRSCANDDFPRLKIEPQSVLNNVLGICKLYFESISKECGDLIQILCDELKASVDAINLYNDKLYAQAISDKAIRRLLIRSGTKFDSGGILA